MNKLKEIFSGKKGDDTHTNQATGDNVEPETRRSSVGRQILNPGGKKYDETLHGTTDTATPAVSNPSQLKTDPNARLETDRDYEQKQQGGVLRQVLNPEGDKRNELEHGTTAHAVGGDSGRTGGLATGAERDMHDTHRTEDLIPGAKGMYDNKDAEVTPQVFNPSGQKYNEQSAPAGPDEHTIDSGVTGNYDPTQGYGGASGVGPAHGTSGTGADDTYLNYGNK